MINNIINYLKDNRLGRATFFPLTVIKERYVDNETINILKNSNDYLGILSDLVVYNQKYDNIVKNQLGTVVVARDLDSATHLSHMINAKYRIVSLDGEKAITKYKVIKNYKDYSELEIRLLTGRTHQIRVHFQSIGHPILGDSLYGKKSDLIERQALHAYKSSFNHPITKQLVEIKATIPNDIKALL